jgi:hypothetical protein
MYRRARAEGYLQVYRMAAREDDEMQDLMDAFVTDNDFTFRNYFGRFVSDVEINARAARHNRVAAAAGLLRRHRVRRRLRHRARPPGRTLSELSVCE